MWKNTNFKKKKVYTLRSGKLRLLKMLLLDVVGGCGCVASYVASDQFSHNTLQCFTLPLRWTQTAINSASTLSSLLLSSCVCACQELAQNFIFPGNWPSTRVLIRVFDNLISRAHFQSNSDHYEIGRYFSPSVIVVGPYMKPAHSQDWLF